MQTLGAMRHALNRAFDQVQKERLARVKVRLAGAVAVDALAAKLALREAIAIEDLKNIEAARRHALRRFAHPANRGKAVKVSEIVYKR